MTTFTGYRTQLLPRDQAERFAACISANRRFQSVRVEESRRSQKADRFFVAYEPTSDTRSLELLTAQQDARVQRAYDQAADYAVVRDGELHYVINLKSGARYQVPIGGRCDCMDSQERCAGTVCRCKHETIITVHYANGWVEGPEPLPDMATRQVAITPEREAEIRADLAGLWP